MAPAVPGAVVPAMGALCSPVETNHPVRAKDKMTRDGARHLGSPGDGAGWDREQVWAVSGEVGKGRSRKGGPRKGRERSGRAE